MSSLTFEITDEKAERLSAAAQEQGLAVEELLRRITDDYLSRSAAFDTATGYVLTKNAELYRRLAR